MHNAKRIIKVAGLPGYKIYSFTRKGTREVKSKELILKYNDYNVIAVAEYL